jgi:hypothetical protein
VKRGRGRLRIAENSRGPIIAQQGDLRGRRNVSNCRLSSRWFAVVRVGVVQTRCDCDARIRSEEAKVTLAQMSQKCIRSACRAMPELCGDDPQTIRTANAQRPRRSRLPKRQKKRPKAMRAPGPSSSPVPSQERRAGATHREHERCYSAVRAKGERRRATRPACLFNQRGMGRSSPPPTLSSYLASRSFGPVETSLPLSRTSIIN